MHATHRRSYSRSRIVLVLAGGLAACTGTMTEPLDANVDGGRSGDAQMHPTADTGVAMTDTGTGVPDVGPRPDAGPRAGTVPIFVAQGMVGRTTISCDEGRTWVANRAWDTEGDPHLCGTTGPIECDAAGGSCGSVWYDGSCSTSSPCDCGHSAGFGKGIAFGDGWFVATFGWGPPGAVSRSRDGVTWEQTLDNDSFGGIAYGAGRFVLASRNPRHGDGLTWSDPGLADFRDALGTAVWSVRRFGYSDYGGGRFVAVASGDVGREILVSSDGGDTWWAPSVLPADCAGSVSTYGGIVAGNGVIVIVDEAANACRSTDGGDTWTVTHIAETNVYAHALWNGSAFWVWGDDGRRYESVDGATWTSTAMITPIRIGPVAISDSGTIVGVTNVWAGYASQGFIRSDDGGLTWEDLPAGAFVPSHPIFSITFGRGQPSALCPLR